MYYLKVVKYPCYRSLSILIPYEIADELDIEEGDVLAVLQKDGECVLRKIIIEVKGRVSDDVTKISRTKRKIKRMKGTDTYLIVLPREWVEKYDLQDENVLVLEQSGVLVILPERLKNDIEEITIRLKKLGTQS